MDRLGADCLHRRRSDLGARQQLVDEIVELDLGRDRRGDALDHLAFDENMSQLLREGPGEHGVDDAGQFRAGEDVFDGCFDSRAGRTHRSARGVEGDATRGRNDPVVAVRILRRAHPVKATCWTVQMGLGG